MFGAFCLVYPRGVLTAGRAAGAWGRLLCVDGWRDGVGNATCQMAVGRFTGFFLGFGGVFGGLSWL